MLRDFTSLLHIYLVWMCVEYFVVRKAVNNSQMQKVTSTASMLLVARRFDEIFCVNFRFLHYFEALF